MREIGSWTGDKERREPRGARVAIRGSRLGESAENYKIKLLRLALYGYFLSGRGVVDDRELSDGLTMSCSRLRVSISG
jgi:hypothetical protein